MQRAWLVALMIALITAFAATGSRAEVVYAYRGTSVIAIESTTGVQTATLTDPLPRPEASAFDPGTNQLFLLSGTTIYTIDTTSDRAANAVTTSTLSRPLHMTAFAFDRERHILWAIDNAQGDLVSIDPETGNVQMIIAATGALGPLALDLAGQRIYSLAPGNRMLAIIDLQTRLVTAKPLANFLFTLAFEPVSRKLFAISDFQGGLVSIDPETAAMTMIYRAQFEGGLSYVLVNPAGGQVVTLSTYACCAASPPVFGLVMVDSATSATTFSPWPDALPLQIAAQRPKRRAVSRYR